MTERQRQQRARMLLKHRIAGHPPAAAWRKVKPDTVASDKSAAEMCVRALSDFRRWLVEHPGEVPPAGDWRQEPKRCIGVADRPCGKEISRRQKRCQACAEEQKRLNQPRYRRNYSPSYREPANAKRNERRGRQQLRELIQKAAAAEQKKREDRAKLPVRVEYNGREYLYYPETGKWEIWGYLDIYDQVGGFHPVTPRDPVPPVPPEVPVLDGDWRQRQREASQPGRAPRADRGSSKQRNLPASSGKNRKAAANGAGPKPRCKICAHPDRAAIDAELLQGLSPPTVAGRYGLSASGLNRHRSRHVNSPTVGDIMEPAGRGDVWREWDGTQWQRIPAPRLDHLKEVQGRPDSIPGRTVFSLELNGGISRGIYRRKTGRPSAGMAARRRR